MELLVRNRFISLASSFVFAISLLAMPNGFFISNAHSACNDEAIKGVDWQNCRKRNLIMDGFNFVGSNFTRSDLSASDLRNTNIKDASFIKANLVRASLAGSNAENANFQGVIASRTDFSRGKYLNADFQKAEIIRSNFSNSNLENANMSKGDFSRVNFFNSNMKSANLSFSNISRSNLIGISFDEKFSLKGAYMFLTKIEDLDLSNLKDIKQWQINMACGNGKTKLPDGLVAPNSWPCEFDEGE